jgi:hypothetical protein
MEDAEYAQELKALGFTGPTGELYDHGVYVHVYRCAKFRFSVQLPPVEHMNPAQRIATIERLTRQIENLRTGS